MVQGAGTVSYELGNPGVVCAILCWRTVRFHWIERKFAARGSAGWYRDSSLLRKTPLLGPYIRPISRVPGNRRSLGPYHRPMPRVLGRSYRGYSSLRTHSAPRMVRCSWVKTYRRVLGRCVSLILSNPCRGGGTFL